MSLIEDEKKTLLKMSEIRHALAERENLTKSLAHKRDSDQFSRNRPRSVSIRFGTGTFCSGTAISVSETAIKTFLTGKPFLRRAAERFVCVTNGNVSDIVARQVPVTIFCKTWLEPSCHEPAS
jgi:hypothetical protein